MNMKYYLALILLYPVFGLSQEGEFNPLKREVIDSIHSKRLCVAYPGMTRVQTTKEAFDESEFVFIGKVLEIIRIEKMEGTDYGIREDGKFGFINFEPTSNYWYVFNVIKSYKGNPTEKIKIFARKFSGTSPFFLLNKEYLIYAMKAEIQEHPYVYCQGNSCHIKYAQNDLKELKEIDKK